MTQAAAARPVLLTRVATAVALLALCLAALFLLANAYWSVLLGIVLIAAGREWAALGGFGAGGQWAYCAALAAAAAT